MFPIKPRIEVYEFGQFRLDVVTRQLSDRGTHLPLPSKTFDLLRLLVENGGRLVTKDDLLKGVWPERVVEENNLTVRISAIRKVLREDTEHRFIETVPGLGYRLVCRVRVVAPRSSQTYDERLTSLAILPIINEKNQRSLDYLCDGITERLINELSHDSKLRIISRGAVLRYKAKDLDPFRVGQELGVQAVLAGNLSNVDNILHLSVELIDVIGGSHLWGASYRRPLSDLFALQEEMAREISSSLCAHVEKQDEYQPIARHTENLEAYHSYLKGQFFLNKRDVPALRRSLSYFRRATRLDPRYALAYASLAEAHRMHSSYGLVSPRRAMPMARAAALRALEIDERLPEAYIALGQIKAGFDWDWIGAEHAYLQAIELSQQNSSAHRAYSILLTKLGRIDRAIEEARVAFEMDPLSLHIQMTTGMTFYFAGHYDAAVAHGKEMLELQPDFAPANGLLGLAYLEKKHYEAAITELETLVSLTASDYHAPSRKSDVTKPQPMHYLDTEALGLLGYGYGVAGEHREARRIQRKLKSYLKNVVVEPQSLALVALGLENDQEVFEWLEQACEERTISLPYIKVWTIFKRLRKDPRYKALITRMGLDDPS